MRTNSPRGGGGIFISYRRIDVAAQAGRLCDRLRESFGQDRVFIDTDSIVVGAEFKREIIARVSRCDVLLALIGPGWLAVAGDAGRRRIDDPDDFVRVEIETALNRDILVVPVLVEGAALPQESDLPPSLRPLCGLQASVLSTPRFNSDVSRLIEALQDIIPPGQKREWKLDRVANQRNKKTFRMSSGKESYTICVEVDYDIGIQISVDDRVVIEESGLPTRSEYLLRDLSWEVGSDVYIRVNLSGWGRITQIVLRIGDQVLPYSIFMKTI
jgi:TIR domain